MIGSEKVNFLFLRFIFLLFLLQLGHQQLLVADALINGGYFGLLLVPGQLHLHRGR